MKINLPESWIPADKIHEVIQLEPAVIIFILALCSWITYKVFLRHLSLDRHRNLRKLFVNLASHSGFMAALYLTYEFLALWAPEGSFVLRLLPYLGLVTLISGSVVLVKTSRIFVFQYLFWEHRNVGVPLLLVNIFTLILSLILFCWIATSIFGVRLAPLLATSAVFSIILGLALQDTLGNLFAGIAMQFDKPYEIGDWIEVQMGLQKWVGQVHEISWRATVLVGLYDEAITVANRVVAQAQISNFSMKTRPIVRNHQFRVPLDFPVQKMKDILLKSVQRVREIRNYPEPLVLISETSDSWAIYKLVYFIDDYGAQFSLADKVLSSVLTELHANGVALASNRLKVELMDQSPPV